LRWNRKGGDKVRENENGVSPLFLNKYQHVTFTFKVIAMLKQNGAF